ncbi:O-antigen polymerase [Chryseomicrobium aureum]|uniref:O-antigen polymerase n=1 Tax=Chryseomicrobium aureum TaxID=1441723 RepID=UPI00370CFFA7
MKMKFIFLTILFKSLLEIVYYFYVYSNYSYAGFNWDPNYFKAIISYTYLILFILLMQKDFTKPSSQLFLLFIYITFIPLSSYYWTNDASSVYFNMVSACFILIILLLNFLKLPLLTKINFVKVRSLDIVNFIFITTLFLLIIFTIILGGIDLRSLDFNSVYELRSESEINGLLGYLFNWIPKVFIPLLLVTYFFERKKFRLSLAIFMQVYFYLMTGHKSFLFSVVLILGLSYILKSKNFQYYLAYFFSAILIISVVLYEISKNIFFIALMPVRQLNIPSHLSFEHFEFFSVNPKLYFSESIIGNLLNIESPYNIHSTFIIGGGNVNANTGFLADAYDNGGLILMLIYSLIFAVFLKLIDALSSGSFNSNIYTAYVVYMIVILNDTGLLTTMLTSGLIILLIFLYFFSSTESKKFEFRSSDS